MSKVPYSKPPLSYSEQLNQLIQRGLNIEDKAKAIHLLEKYPNIDIKSMGFPDDWQSEKFWE